jgi:hypothetical protein
MAYLIRSKGLPNAKTVRFVGVILLHRCFKTGGRGEQGSKRNDCAFVDYKGYFTGICFIDPCKGGTNIFGLFSLSSFPCSLFIFIL